MKNKYNQGNQGNPYGNQGNPYGNQGYNPNIPPPPYNNQGYNPNQGYNSNQGYNPNQGGIGQGNPYQGYNPNNANFNPYKQMDLGSIGLAPNAGNAFVPNPTPANLGPNFYVPADVVPSNKPNPAPRSSINSINDIDYYPEIDSDAPLFNKGAYSDPSFDQICEKLKKGL